MADKSLIAHPHGEHDADRAIGRRGFVGDLFRIAAAVGLVGSGALLARRKGLSGEMVWQLDPTKCIACGNCATHCVLDESAVKCVDSFEICGYCNRCPGYFELNANDLNTGAENQLCPTGALRRDFVQHPYYEYTIISELCIGCGKCVKGCEAFGNGSLYLQVCHDRCKDCNECSIAVACPSQAFRRVRATEPYLLKKREGGG